MTERTGSSGSINITNGGTVVNVDPEAVKAFRYGGVEYRAAFNNVSQAFVGYAAYDPNTNTGGAIYRYEPKTAIERYQNEQYYLRVLRPFGRVTPANFLLYSIPLILLEAENSFMVIAQYGGLVPRLGEPSELQGDRGQILTLIGSPATNEDIIAASVNTVGYVRGSVRNGDMNPLGARVKPFGTPGPVVLSEEAILLNKSLASQAQMSTKGRIMAGVGSERNVIFRGAAKMAAQYGGEPSDWVKKN